MRSRLVQLKQTVTKPARNCRQLSRIAGKCTVICRLSRQKKVREVARLEAARTQTALDQQELERRAAPVASWLRYGASYHGI